MIFVDVAKKCVNNENNVKKNVIILMSITGKQTRSGNSNNNNRSFI